MTRVVHELVHIERLAQHRGHALVDADEVVDRQRRIINAASCMIVRGREMTIGVVTALGVVDAAGLLTVVPPRGSASPPRVGLHADEVSD